MNQWRRNLVAVLLVLFFGGLSAFGVHWILTHAFQRPYTEQSLRLQWQQDGTLMRLRAWADARIGKAVWGTNEPETVPRISGGAHVFDVWPVKGTSGSIDAVAIMLGGADNHHGLLIGAKPTQFWFPIKSQWTNDVYWFDEVPDRW
jgi:hypothetical protein